MSARVHRLLKVIAFNANGIWRQWYEVNKPLQDQHIDVALLSETHPKPHERFFIPKYHFYCTNRFPGRKGGTAIAVRGKHSPLPSRPASPCFNRIHGFLLAAVYKSKGHTWNNVDIIERLSFRHQLLLAGDINAKHPFWNSVVS
jgi:exonuclease III